MKKAEQIRINKECERMFNKAVEEIKWYHEARRLRSCSAKVYETENYYILRSYNTLIACINKETKRLYDVLRTEYGYTATSAQHIAKFRNDYRALDTLVAR